MSLGDPAFINTTAPIAALLSDSYMAALAAATKDSGVQPLGLYGGEFNKDTGQLPRPDYGTSHISVVDR